MGGYATWRRWQAFLMQSFSNANMTQRKMPHIWFCTTDVSYIKESSQVNFIYSAHRGKTPPPKKNFNGDKRGRNLRKGNREGIPLPDQTDIQQMSWVQNRLTKKHRFVKHKCQTGRTWTPTTTMETWKEDRPHTHTHTEEAESNSSEDVNRLLCEAWRTDHRKQIFKCLICHTSLLTHICH